MERTAWWHWTDRCGACWKVKVMVVIDVVDIIMGINVFNQLRGVLLDKEKVEIGQDVQ